MKSTPVTDRYRDGRDLTCHARVHDRGMTNERLLWNAPRPAAREARAGERLWSAIKDERRIASELREFRLGSEVQLLLNDEFYGGRFYRSREWALQAADACAEGLRHAGWSVAR